MIWLVLLLASPESDRRAEVQRSAEAAARPALVTICNGRCELVDVRADVVAEQIVKDALPGFEGLQKEETSLVVRSLEVTVAVDARLSQQTKNGIKDALQTALRGMARTIDVNLRAFEWPAAREQAPIVVQMQQQPPQLQAPPQPVVITPPSPVDEPDLVLRLQKRFVDGAPWLLGAFVVAWILASALRKREPAARAGEPGAPPASPSQDVRAGDLSFGDKALADRALAAHVLRRLLTRCTPDEAAAMLPLVPLDALADAMDGAFASELAHVLQLSRGKKAIESTTVVAFEQHIVAAQRACLHDARLYRLHLVSEEVLAAVLSCLPAADRVRAWIYASPDVREAAGALLAEADRQALVGRVMAAVSRGEVACDEEAAARIDRACEAKARAARLLESVAADAVNARADAPTPAWAAILEAESLSEADIATADDERVVELIFALQPEPLVDYLHVAEPPARAKIVAKLPGYLVKALDGSAAPTSAAAAKARREVLSAFRRLRRHHDRAAQRAIVALLAEESEGAHGPVVKVVK